MTVTQSSNQSELKFDPKPERNFHGLIREVQLKSEENELALDLLFASDFDLKEEEVMAVADRTLKELVAPDLNQ
ncbi:hypothetical protein PTKIN_Ptkin01aG0093500 [Pterospermum kingtungense]